ncbi:MAG: helix-hairpin-helix domain-containing protein [Spirochaetota bacterium]
MFQNARYSSPGEILRSFILEYYAHAEIPQKIIIQDQVEDFSLIAEHFTAKSGRAVSLAVAKAHDERGVITMIQRNIDILFAERAASVAPAAALADLQTALNLPSPPEMIVCFDISNIQGTHAVASMSCIRSGIADKTNYRRFKIRAWKEANDPAMIHEALSRYLQGAVNGEHKMPDLVVIDGGPTQLTRAREAAKALDVTVPIISIAKKNEELFFHPEKEPIVLPRSSAALKLIQRLRDESHRFGVTYHRKLRDSAMISSELDDIEGIGPSKRNALLKNFGSVERIKAASPEDIAAVKGISSGDAQSIFRFFHA